MAVVVVVPVVRVAQSVADVVAQKRALVVQIRLVPKQQGLVLLETYMVAMVVMAIIKQNSL